MNRFISAAFILSVCNPAWGAERKPYTPLSFDPPPKTIEGVTTADVLKFLRDRKYTQLDTECHFCPLNGLQWQAKSTTHTGTASVQSYLGNDELTALHLQSSGFFKSTPGNPPENMPKVIDELSNEATVLCRSADQKSRLATHLRESLTHAVYKAGGRILPNGVILFKDVHVFEGFRIEIHNELNYAAALTFLQLSAAQARTWQDKTGQFQVAATYVSHNSEQVTLLKEDGKQINVPLARLGDADAKFLANRIAERDEPPGVTAVSDAAARAKPPTRWLNTSYNTTIYKLPDGRWAEMENPSKKIKWYLKETARTDTHVELFNTVRKETWRLSATEMELKKGDQWGPLATGRWVAE